MCKYFYMSTSLPIAISCIFCFNGIHGQINNQKNRQITIQAIDTVIQIDGLEEEVWSTAGQANSFFNHRPSDVGLAESKTTIKMLFNKHFIYILVKAFSDHNRTIVQTLKRDDFFDNDGLGIVLDPINRQSNGFFFGISSRGAQSEGLIAESGQADWNWDAKWYSKVVHKDGYWLAEMAIPFYVLRYNESNRTWGINFVRNDLLNNMYSTWVQFPTNFSELDLGYTGTLNWESDIPRAKKRIAVIPSITSTTGRDFQTDEPSEVEWTPSLDVKYALTSSLNLDLTINPDFSQIEVDRQVTNLSRFSLFFPERRTFFLENSDLFSSFGRSGIRPFFSRKIGLSGGQSIPIQMGARLTGNVTEKLRLGLMNVRTAEAGAIRAQSYSVAAVQHRILKRSSIGGIFVNRQDRDLGSDYNRVGGTELNLSSEDGSISGSVMYNQSFSDGRSGSNDFASSSVFVNSRSYRLYFQADHIGKNYLADVGFTPRLYNYDAVRDTTIRIGYQQYNLFGAWDFRPAKGKSVFHGPRFQTILYTNNGNRFNEWYNYLGYEIDFADQSQFDTGINHYRVNLLFPLVLLNDTEPLPTGIYNYTDLFLDWDSDPRKHFGYGTVFTAGAFYNGNRTGLRSYVQYRIQPWLRLRLDHDFNRVNLEQYGKADINLIALRTEVSFSNNIFWTTFLQYNTQATNFNINSRFQWRFAPQSDLFIAYTDNYYSDIFSVKNRFLSFKINYWINL